MTRQEIMKELKHLLLDLGKDQKLIDSMQESSNIKLDLGLDSIALVYLMFQIQNKYGIDVKDIKTSDFVIVKDFVDFLIGEIR